MKWKHAPDEGLGAVRKSIEVYHTGKALWDIGKAIVPMLIKMIHSLNRAYHHTTKMLGHAYREGRKYARGFDQFMNAAG